MPNGRNRCEPLLPIACGRFRWVFAATYFAAVTAAHADSVVNFWISPVDQGPAAPTIYAAPGANTELTVWARPAVGYKLTAFSLNLVAAQEGILSFDEVEVMNPALGGGTFRHQLVFDTPTGLIADPDGVRAFQGFTFFPGEGELPVGVGIGPACNGDPCCSSASGAASWHVATVTVHPLGYGTTNLFLEIGNQGLWQSPAAAMEPDPPGDTTAVFGLSNDLIHHWDSSPGPDLRNMHIGAADAVIHVATADFDVNLLVDGADLLRWQRGLGSGNTLGQGDANDDNLVNSADLAAWKYQFGETFSAVPTGTPIPECQGLSAALFAAAMIASRFARRPGS